MRPWRPRRSFTSGEVARASPDINQAENKEINWKRFLRKKDFDINGRKSYNAKDSSESSFLRQLKIE